ncbi:putative sodium/metabolite cotransporter bass3, chloroplastic [Orobanche gracilis]
MSPIYCLSLQSSPSTLFFHPKNSISFSLKNHSSAPIPKGFLKKGKNVKGVSLFAVACSTSSPFIGKVGLQKREGNYSLLSFGMDPKVAFVTKVQSDASHQVLSALLPFVVALTAVAALSKPSTFTWKLKENDTPLFECSYSRGICRVSKELYAPALGGIMLSIGIRLSVDDFALAFKRPLPLCIGFIAQYVIKPALGLFVARAFGISPMFYAGFILTSCVAGAQLSSYASFLSKGDVALSIILTSCSTVASVLVTPLLTDLLVGSVVPVDAVAMSKSILQVVLAPVTLGLLLNTYAKPVVHILQPVMPFVAMICTSMCIGSPLALNRCQIISAEGLRLVGPVLTFHAAAFALGYWFSKIGPLRLEEEVCRTISAYQ